MNTMSYMVCLLHAGFRREARQDNKRRRGSCWICSSSTKDRASSTVHVDASVHHHLLKLVAKMLPNPCYRLPTACLSGLCFCFVGQDAAVIAHHSISSYLLVLQFFFEKTLINAQYESKVTGLQQVDSHV